MGDQPGSQPPAPVTHSVDGEFIRLLWTGGWDSTFRLLQLLLDQGRSVEPHYLIDPKRGSVSIELETMDAIRFRLAERYPQTRRLLLPSRIADARDLPPDDEVHNSMLRLVAAWNLGSQYGWLARYCRHAGFMGVEMGLERPPLGEPMVTGRLKGHARSLGEGPGRVYEIAPQFREQDVGVVFRYFHFALFDLWKTEMLAIAAERGWRDIMGMTWFCHSPLRDRTPCGLCHPCTYAIRMGLKWRVPLRRRLRFYATHHGMRCVLSNHPHLYAAARKAYRLRRPLRSSTGPALPPSQAAAR